MSTDRPYTPIDCSLHDRLEAAATLRRPVTIVYRDAHNGIVNVEDRIVDILVRDGVELLKIANGSEIRLDDVDSVDGHAFRAAKPPTAGGDAGS